MKPIDTLFRNSLLVTTTIILFTACGTTPPKPESPAEPTLTTPETPTAPPQLSDAEKIKLADAQSAIEEKNPELAIKLLKPLTRSKPTLLPPWINLAVAHYHAGEEKDAEKIATHVLTLAPDQPQALNTLGLLHMKRGELSAAESAYTRAIAASPDYAAAHFNLALLYDIYYQDIAKAVKHYTHYLKYNPRPDESTQRWVEQLIRSLERDS